ncbi:MAG: ROK family protein [Anaerolineae bacterium]|nr:MAG: ROK family protein [Anaerolineae bacterium]
MRTPHSYFPLPPLPFSHYTLAHGHMHRNRHRRNPPACGAVRPRRKHAPGIRKVDTRQPGRSPEEALFALVESIWPQEGRVSAIAAACPGPVNRARGILHTAPNIPEWQEYPLAEHLQARFGVPAAIDNDANLAALGEWRFGAGQGHHHILYLTVSTGIGGGIIMDDHLLHGAHGLAGELGHLTILPNGPVCGCGQRGHLEAVASGTAIARQVRAALEAGSPSRMSLNPPPTTREIAQAAAEGDSLAQEALSQAGTYLGVALADYLHVFNPTCLIIGGGVARSGDVLLQPLQDALRTHVMSPRYLDDLVVTTAALEDNAGLLGALVLAQQVTSP